MPQFPAVKNDIKGEKEKWNLLSTILKLVKVKMRFKSD